MSLRMVKNIQPGWQWYDSERKEWCTVNLIMHMEKISSGLKFVRVIFDDGECAEWPSGEQVEFRTLPEARMAAKKNA
jgi:hypothetical protein